jgi:hypothetical protein
MQVKMVGLRIKAGQDLQVFWHFIVMRNYYIRYIYIFKVWVLKSKFWKAVNFVEHKEIVPKFRISIISPSA